MEEGKEQESIQSSTTPDISLYNGMYKENFALNYQHSGACRVFKTSDLGKWKMFRFNLNTRHITTESDSKETSIDAEDGQIIIVGFLINVIHVWYFIYAKILLARVFWLLWHNYISEYSIAKSDFSRYAQFKDNAGLESYILTLSLIVPHADNLCIQFATKNRPDMHWYRGVQLFPGVGVNSLFL